VIKYVTASTNKSRISWNLTFYATTVVNAGLPLVLCYLARQACLCFWHIMPNGYKMCLCYFLFNGPLETNYLRMYWTDLYQIFKICTYMGGRDQSDLLTTDFWHKLAKIGTNPPPFCALALHNGWEDSNIWMRALTLPMTPLCSVTHDFLRNINIFTYLLTYLLKNLVNFGTVTAEICGLQAFLVWSFSFRTSSDVLP